MVQQVADGINNVVSSGGSLLGTAFKGVAITSGLIMLSTVTAAATGGISAAAIPVTAEAATAAGDAISQFTPSSVLNVMQQGLSHNFEWLSGVISPDVPAP